MRIRPGDPPCQHCPDRDRCRDPAHLLTKHRACLSAAHANVFMFGEIPRISGVRKDTYGRGKDAVNGTCDGGDMDPCPTNSGLRSHPPQTDPSEMDILPRPI